MEVLLYYYAYHLCTSDLKIVSFKKGIGIEKASDEEVWKQDKRSDSMETSQRWSSRIIKK